MNNLIPEKRPDKNGKVVTRHVNKHPGTSGRITGLKQPTYETAADNFVRKVIFDDPQFMRTRGCVMNEALLSPMGFMTWGRTGELEHFMPKKWTVWNAEEHWKSVRANTRYVDGGILDEYQLRETERAVANNQAVIDNIEVGMRDYTIHFQEPYELTTTSLILTTPPTATLDWQIECESFADYLLTTYPEYGGELRPSLQGVADRAVVRAAYGDEAVIKYWEALNAGVGAWTIIQAIEEDIDPEIIMSL